MDIFVAGIGTGGTITGEQATGELQAAIQAAACALLHTGTGRYLREQNPAIQVRSANNSCMCVKGHWSFKEISFLM